MPNHSFPLSSVPPERPDQGQVYTVFDAAGPTPLEALAPACAEAYAKGVVINDLGFEKLWEWMEDGRDGEGARLVAQLLLMALHRAERLGYTVDEVAEFLRQARSNPV